MAEYDNTDTGALFKNDKKGNENWPDYRGSINVGGDEYWLNAWLKTSKKGEKYMSLSVKPKEAKQAPQKKAPEPPQAPPDFDDDIPFAHAWIALPLVGFLAAAVYAANYVA